MKLVRELARRWYVRKAHQVEAALRDAGIESAPGTIGTEWTPYGLGSIAVVALFRRRVALIDLGRRRGRAP